MSSQRGPLRREALCAVASGVVLALSSAGHAQAGDAAAPFQIDAADVEAASSAAAPFAITQQDVSGRVITYQGTETAGNAAITNNEGDEVRFQDQSSADQATIVNNSGGSAHFSDQSGAGSAFMTNNSDSLIAFTDGAAAEGSNITNNEGGTVSFSGQSTGGTAAIANNGTVAFTDTANAGQANIVSNEGATVTFSGQSGAGTMQITNNGTLGFSGNASAGQASITNNEGAQAAFSGNSTAGGAAFANNGSLGFTDNATAGDSSIVNNQTGSVTFGGNASAGSAVIVNNGQLGFSGSSTAADAEIINNATGAMTVSGNATLGSARLNNGGTVEFSGNSSAGSSAIITGPDGRTVFRGGSSGGLAALEADAGGLVDFSGVTAGGIAVGSIQGPGTYQLGGVRLTVGGNGLSTTVDGAIVDGGIYGGSGGGLTKVGAGTLTLSGTNGYTGATIVSAGVLQAGKAGTFSEASDFVVESGAKLDLAAFDQTIASLAGAGAVDLATARLTAGASGRSTIFSGGIEGTGGLTKTGAGTLELSGTSTYSGDTLIEGGQLVVSGSIAASSVLVGAGTGLSGTGTVGAASVSGTLARSNDGGTMTVAGDLTFQAGSTYHLTLSASPSVDLLTVGGTASLSGGKLLVSPTGGFTLQGSSFRILSAAAVDGEFASAQTDMPFIDLDLTYGAGTVDLEVSRNGRDFASAAESANQRSVAEALEGLGGGTLYDAVVASASEAAARQAFDALSGDIYPTLATGLLANDDALRDLVLEQGQAVYGAPVRPDRRIWVRPYGASYAADGDGNAGGYDGRGGGVLAGGDADLGGWTLGAAAGYGRSRYDGTGRASAASVDTLSAGAYSAWVHAGLHGTVGALFSWHSIDASRTVSFGTFSDAVTASYGARSGQVFGEVRYPLPVAPGVHVDPFANMAYAWWSADGFSENGGDAALSVEGSRAAGLTGTLGLRMGADMAVRDNLSLKLGAVAGWRFSTIGETGNRATLGGSDPFFVGGLPMDRNAAVFGVSAVLSSPRMSLGLGYEGSVGELARRHSVRGVLNVRF